MTVDPNIPAPTAPIDWSPENIDPAETRPILDWIADAAEPAAIPACVNPTADKTGMEATFATVTAPVVTSPFLIELPMFD